MPQPGKRWFHVTIGTHRSWLPGDPRGFRDHGHRIHSSGDYRHRPPAGEHAGLLRYSQAEGGPPTRIPGPLQREVGERLRDYLLRLGHRVLAVAVSSRHVHVLVELPAGGRVADRELGRAKQSVALAVRKKGLVRLWAKRAGFKPIADADHQRATLDYIARHRGEGAWVWTFREDPAR